MRRRPRSTLFPPTPLSGASHTVSVTDTDAAGNSKSAAVTFTLDTTLTAPSVALATDSGQPGDGLKHAAPPEINTFPPHPPVRRQPHRQRDRHRWRRQQQERGRHLHTRHHTHGA